MSSEYVCWLVMLQCVSELLGISRVTTNMSFKMSFFICWGILFKILIFFKCWISWFCSFFIQNEVVVPSGTVHMLSFLLCEMVYSCVVSSRCSVAVHRPIIPRYGPVHRKGSNLSQLLTAQFFVSTAAIRSFAGCVFCTDAFGCPDISGYISASDIQHIPVDYPTNDVANHPF